MSTYLQLCQALRQECSDSGTGPSTVVGQSGELGRICKWIADSWYEIQQHRDDYLFARKSFTVPTVASTGEYAYNATGLVDTVSAAAVTRFSRWYRERFTAYLQSTGVGAEYDLLWMDWEWFKRIYRFGTQNDGQPAHVSIDPLMRICLGPKPDAVYVLAGDYQIGPQTLAVDADVPEMPTRFHNLIVYEAMVRYGFNRVAAEALQFAQEEGSRLQSALELDQLPKMGYGSPLA